MQKTNPQTQNNGLLYDCHCSHIYLFREYYPTVTQHLLFSLSDRLSYDSFPFCVFTFAAPKNPPRWFLIRNIWCAWIQKINTAKDAGIHWKQWEHGGIQHCDKKSAISNLAAWKYTYEEGWIESLWKEGGMERFFYFAFACNSQEWVWKIRIMTHSHMVLQWENLNYAPRLAKWNTFFFWHLPFEKYNLEPPEWWGRQASGIIILLLLEWMNVNWMQTENCKHSLAFLLRNNQCAFHGTEAMISWWPEN